MEDVENSRSTKPERTGENKVSASRIYESTRKAMNRNWCNQKANPAFKT